MKTRTELVLEKTRPPVEAPAARIPLKTPATPEAIAAITAEMDALAASTAARRAELQEQANQLYAICHPRNVMLQDLQRLNEAIVQGEKNRAAVLPWCADLSARVDAMAGSADAVPQGFHFLVRGDFAYLLHAKIFIEEIDRWLAERRAEIPVLEKRIRDYASANGIDHGLPVEGAA